MNVTFRLPDEALEKQLVTRSNDVGPGWVEGASARVGGIRASLYNAFPREGVEALVASMKEFRARSHG